MKILITSASRKVFLIRAFQKALEMEGGGSVVAVDISAHAPALYFANEHYLVPRSSEPCFIESLMSLCHKVKIDLIVPTRDEELEVFASHKKAFRENGIDVAVADIGVIRYCQDKAMFQRFCEENGFHVPKRIEVNGSNYNDIEYPVFVKPRVGKGGSGACIVNSAPELKCICECDVDIIVQEVIAADEYSMDLFADRSGNVISVVPRKRIRVLAGESVVSMTVRNDQLVKESSRLAAKLGLIGHNTLQAFYDDGVVKFIEVNPRYGGAANLGFYAGPLTPRYLIRMTKGEKIEMNDIQYKEGVLMLRYAEDLFIDAK